MFRCGSPGSSRPWRGFPIRTPWDHSPVIDSPRLIADSYVLLRLLMPRHPPCALKNLTTKDQGVIFERTMKTTIPPKDGTTDPGSYSWKLLLIKDARVHYVVLKQQPRTTHPTPAPAKGPNHVIGAARKPETNKPHNPPHAPHQNGETRTRPWSCCLRTQQCAKHYPTIHSGERSRTRTPKGTRSVLAAGMCRQAPIC